MAWKRAKAKHIIKLSFYHALKPMAETMRNFVVAHDDKDTCKRANGPNARLF